jgi:hypothetical protein
MKEGAMNDAPLLTFKSHVSGKNSDVAIYVDRVEWAQEGHLGTGGKLMLGVATGGLSLLKTGVSGKTKGSEVILVRSISSVTTQRDGLRFIVRVITTGNTIDFRVGSGDAQQIKDLLTSLMLGRHPQQQTATAPQQASMPAPAGPPPGWYADPGGSGKRRWWDGTNWTEHLEG